MICGLFCIGGSLLTMQAQTVLTLDSCRAMALRNNKDLKIAREKVNSAYYERKAAFTNFLPNFTAEGTYMHNEKEISLLNKDQKAAISGLGTTAQTELQGAMKQMIAVNPDLQSILAPFASMDIASPLNSIGQSIVDAFRSDTRNVFAGALTLTQPIYMGGKIVAYNKITHFAENLAKAQQKGNMQDVILNTDQAYWQVVSLANKKRLAESYLALVEKLNSDVDKMIKEGVATKADGLSVKVKVNEANMTLTQVDDGLNLTRMLLCQLCGLDITSDIRCSDEEKDEIPVVESNPKADIETAWNNRSELESLHWATDIYKQKVNVVRADFLPQIVFMGNYIVSNPSLYNGFEKKFKGMWNLGVTVTVPIYHWGEGTYKVRAAKADARSVQYQLDDAKEKIELQVTQSTFKVNEANKRLAMALKDREKADENLRYANLGFKEGVIPTSNVLEAQTAWLKAQSSKIDAQIDVQMADVYLKKSLGIIH